MDAHNPSPVQKDKKNFLKSFWHFIERLQIHFHVTDNVPGIEY